MGAKGLRACGQGALGDVARGLEILPRGLKEWALGRVAKAIRMLRPRGLEGCGQALGHVARGPQEVLAQGFGNCVLEG